MAFAVASCTEEEIVEDKVLGKPGEEVKFTLSLDKKSRTVYGDGNVDEDDQVVSYPIYWVDGDKVQVYSPHALSDRNNAEYKVVLPTGVEKPYYAEDLEKTGDYGVQWGEGSTDENGNSTGLHDFYSIYPSGNYEFSKVSNEDGSFSMVASGLEVAERQTINFEKGKYVHEMSNCLMYATTPKVDMGVGVVNLSYNPLSTVLWFELPAKEQATPQDPQNFMILGIELESTSTIAGTFKFDVSNGSFKSWQTEAKKITISAMDKSGTQELSHSVTAGTTFEFPVFLAPGAVNLEDMTITVVTDKGTYKKKLDKTLTNTNDNHALTAGMIHKIKLPKMSVTAEGWDVSTWMKYIPRNVYLSEISIPGSWNSLNPEFQGTSPTISGQYDKGVRAFHLDTRWQGNYSNWRWNITDLGVANGGNTSNVATDQRVMTDDDNPTVDSALDEIIGNLKSDEYMILICSFAQGSYNHTYTENEVTYDWAGEISRLCSEKDGVYDAKNLTASTVVGDVLGRVIVIVNIEGDVSNVPSDSKCLFVNMPMTLSSGDFSAVLNDRLDVIKKSGSNGTTAIDSDISIYNTHAQTTKNQDAAYTGSGQNGDRGYVPSKGQRITEINNILDWSKNNYNSPNFGHDKWIYLGLGGYYASYNSGFIGINEGWKTDSDGHKNVASDYNGLINGRVTEMGTIPNGQEKSIPYYPVGIVLMNFTNDYSSTVKNILLLNNKYRLQYDSTKPVDYRPNDSLGGEGGDAM